MNRSLEVFTKLYKPYRITKINSVYIFETMDGNFALKLNPKINYNDLYKYLYSRSFSYLPSLSKDSRDDMVVFSYEEDILVDNEQKALDLVDLMSLLHSKTSYYKKINIDKYKEIFDVLNNNINYINKYYEDLFMEYLNEEYNIPSHYLLLRNYSIIHNAIRYCSDKLDNWYILIKDKNEQRVVLNHGNLKLEHLIKNNESYLISWDNCIIDTPVLDLFILYKNEWENVSFKELFSQYNNCFNLLEEEKMLFDILISIPYKVEITDNEYELCYEFRRMINYLYSSSKIVLDD